VQQLHRASASGSGTRQQIKLGTETGNAIFDAGRGMFWITVVADTPPDQLVEIDPVAAQVKTTDLASHS
jgi:hypothetical protein